MSVAHTVEDCLQKHRISYSLVHHPRSGSSTETANRAHVALAHLAKAVVLADHNGVVMAVVPGDHHVHLRRLSETLGRNLSLVSEQQLKQIFPDCAPGAVPPLGTAYGLETFVDNRLVYQGNTFFEAGDHEELVQVDNPSFLKLLRGARFTRFSD